MLTQSQREAIIAQMAELNVSYYTRKRPRNYEELVLAAKAELRNRFDELMERAELILELFRDFDGVDWGDPPMSYLAIADYGDNEHMDKLVELVENWKDVRSAPGEGYW